MNNRVIKHKGFAHPASESNAVALGKHVPVSKFTKTTARDDRSGPFGPLFLLPYLQHQFPPYTRYYSEPAILLTLTMQTFTFNPTLALTPAILAKKTTTATVEYRAGFDQQIFVPASLEAGADTQTWRATVQSVPRHSDDFPQQAVLHVTKGELGRHLGSVELGAV